MRHIVSFFAIAILGVLVFTACNSAELKTSKGSSPAAPIQATKTPADGIRRVTVAELKDLLAKNGALVIDVRNEESYKASHIKGSKLIPEAEVAKRSDELPKDKLIVTYCS
ncbi:MAG TPA: rhodanese-like domain-containing protein [Pyrinomonadaceae bacterium]|nr:rhodanese-like domain-containing protein [Pyrinomonadaceae bacterium]